MKLYRVKPSLALHWPPQFGSPSLRGLGGYVVDLDAPHEREWCDGMMHVLEPAGDGAMPTPITNPVALRVLRAAPEQQPKKPEPAKVGGSLPPVDVPAKKPEPMVVGIGAIDGRGKAGGAK